MEKVFYYECVVRCKADGKLLMSAGVADAVIRAREGHVLGLDGLTRYRELLSLGAFCEEQRRDREAMSAYMEVVDHIMTDRRLHMPKGARRRLYEQAAEGLMRLCSSPDEVVWEICSQECDRWRNAV